MLNCMLWKKYMYNNITDIHINRKFLFAKTYTKNITKFVINIYNKLILRRAYVILSILFLISLSLKAYLFKKKIKWKCQTYASQSLQI